MKELLIVGIGGFVGSAGRYGIYLLTLKHLSEKTYVPTLLVNLIGCFLIGLFVGGFFKLSPNQNLLLVTGLCGGFTTFSAFAFDGLKLLKNGFYGQFVVYFSASAMGGLLLCMLGYYLSSKLSA